MDFIKLKKIVTSSDIMKLTLPDSKISCFAVKYASSKDNNEQLCELMRNYESFWIPNNRVFDILIRIDSVESFEEIPTDSDLVECRHWSKLPSVTKVTLKNGTVYFVFDRIGVVDGLLLK